MYYIDDVFENEILINKSRFIAVLYPIEDVSDINEKIAATKKKYPKATHYTTGYVLGINGETGGNSDDGEPSGTAGMPIFEILKQHNITNVLCIVIRYFGGVKLGAGGLIRAYGKSANEVLKIASLYQKVDKYIYETHLSYSLYDNIKRKIEEHGVIINQQFLENVILTFYTEGNNLDFLDDHLHLLKIDQVGNKIIKLFKEN